MKTKVTNRSVPSWPRRNNKRSAGSKVRLDSGCCTYRTADMSTLYIAVCFVFIRLVSPEFFSLFVESIQTKIFIDLVLMKINARRQCRIYRTGVYFVPFRPPKINRVLLKRTYKKKPLVRKKFIKSCFLR